MSIGYMILKLGENEKKSRKTLNFV